MTVGATNVLDSTESAAMTVRERAAAVIKAGKIDLNCKLGVFTVIGTLEPQVVRLFPQTCLCSVQSACYHVTGACMSVGVGLADEPQSRRINLTCNAYTFE